MSLVRLKKAAPPPAEPEDGAGDWAAVEKKLGLSLPADYKQLIEVYGTGQFMDFVIVYNPFSKNPDLHLLKRGNGTLKAARMARKDLWDLEEEEYPFPLYPETGGLLPWGTTTNGDSLYWQTKGSPAKWPIVVWGSRGPEHKVYPLVATEFLVRWMTGQVKCPIFPKKDKHAIPEFTPLRVHERVYIDVEDVTGTFDEQLKRLRGHFSSPAIKRRHRSETRNQCVFPAGRADTEILFEGRPLASRIRIDYPKRDEKEIKSLVRAISSDLGWMIRKVFKTVGAYSKEKSVWKDVLTPARDS